MATDLHTAANRLLKAWDLNDLIHEHIEALRQALANKALDKMAENARELGLDYEPAQQEPVAHRDGFWCADLTCKKCYSADFRFKHKNSVVNESLTTPAQRTWVGLTDEEIDKIPCELYAPDQGGMTMEEGLQVYARAIEAKLKEKNT